MLLGRWPKWRKRTSRTKLSNEMENGEGRSEYLRKNMKETGGNKRIRYTGR
jgi:hypothetical protein